MVINLNMSTPPPTQPTAGNGLDTTILFEANLQKKNRGMHIRYGPLYSPSRFHWRVPFFDGQV